MTGHVSSGLLLPIVYNTSCYDSLDSLALIDGIVDIYLPDLKVCTPEFARRHLRMPGYPKASRAALTEMTGRPAALRRGRAGPPRPACAAPGDARDAGRDLGCQAGRLACNRRIVMPSRWK